MLEMVTVTINATARNDVANVPVFTPATENGATDVSQT